MPDRILEKSSQGDLSFCVGRFANVRFWHKADIPEPPINVRFQG
jgi:hypothetical protein